MKPCQQEHDMNFFAKYITRLRFYLPIMKESAHYGGENMHETALFNNQRLCNFADWLQFEWQ